MIYVFINFFVWIDKDKLNRNNFNFWNLSLKIESMRLVIRYRILEIKNYGDEKIMGRKGI